MKKEIFFNLANLIQSCTARKEVAMLHPKEA